MKRKILNVGCGDDTYGTHFVDRWPSRPEVKKVDINREKLPYNSNTFDEACFEQVLQSLKNPVFALKEIHRVLKPGGILKLTTLNKDFIGWKVPNKMSRGRYTVRVLFEKKELENILKEINFEMISSNYYKYVKIMDWKRYFLTLAPLIGKYGYIAIHINARKKKSKSVT